MLQSTLTASLAEDTCNRLILIQIDIKKILSL
jgi:hypothetical protein